jgi:hypothetical protein
LFDEKSQRSKISCQGPFKDIDKLKNVYDSVVNTVQFLIQHCTVVCGWQGGICSASRCVF